MPGFVHVCSELENCPACELKSCLVSFTLFIGLVNAAVDSRERCWEKGALRREGLFLCQSHCDQFKVFLEVLTAAWKRNCCCT